MMFPKMFFHLILSINLFPAAWSVTYIPHRRDVIDFNMADQLLLTPEGACGGAIVPLAA